jgi:hypothetical protein
MASPLNLKHIDMLDDTLVEILRNKTPGERLAMGLEMNRTARLMIAASLRSYHPDWTEEQVLAEVARRMFDGTN